MDEDLREELGGLGDFQLAAYSRGLHMEFVKNLPEKYPSNFKSVLACFIALDLPMLGEKIIEIAKDVWKDKEYYEH